MPEPYVLVGMPGPHPQSWETTTALLQASLRGVRWYFQPKVSSLLPYACNSLWAQALTMRAEGVTHFVMLHSDVAPEPGWLDVLLDEQARCQADVLSVIIPIKDDRGVTSTAALVTTGEGRTIRRLTMTEACQLPVTFTQQELPWTGVEALLVNTGCMLCTLAPPWVEDVCFAFQDGITRLRDGTFAAWCVPEDWHFSMRVQQCGGTVAATRRLPVSHHGVWEWRNTAPWGTWPEDKGDQHL